VVDDILDLGILMVQLMMMDPDLSEEECREMISGLLIKRPTYAVELTRLVASMISVV
jgi:hypothetical protein